ncbi:choice-of-anchor B family protein [Alteromonadaceae bacterium BrNp21-10]|nr:choice-of-anchor B family protein [Alteromonadaceae bacterium BrNp21-10]
MRFILFISLLSFSQAIFAHAEHDKNRYVATDGKDSMRCDNPKQPCRTISYAAQHANKGDKILVAAGQYQGNNDNELFYLISQVTPIQGGYSTIDHYAQQAPSIHNTTLVGIPKEYVEQLQQQGFSVIRDTKAKVANNLAAKLSSLNALSQKQIDQDCINGFAAEFPCSNVSLVAHLPLSEFAGNHSSANDIWGHIDLNTGTEYALIGLRRGTAVVSLADPQAPMVVGVISGTSTTWRDIKVYQYYDAANTRWRAYAYVTSDSTSEGITIIDLNSLPNQISLVQRQPVFASAHNIYISDVDYGLNIAAPGKSPLIHIAGANKYSGSQHSYSLSNPESLSEVLIPNNANADDYSHDVSSLRISDERSNQCPNATADCLVVLDFNEDSFRLWDQSLASTRVNLSNTTYNQASYVHSGWWSENKNYVFVHDELDEQNHGINSTLRIFEITDLSSPQHVGTWTGPTRAIDHNGFVRGNRYYMSNYERGMTILDISDPSAPTDIGFFDTFPSSDNASFNGAWGVYPFLPSGLILVSDINSGLYILRDHTTSNNNNAVAFSAATHTIAEGDSLTLSVHRSGDTTKAFSVEYEILSGSAHDNDVPLGTGNVSWPANDAEDQTINIVINQDIDDNEYDEVFFVRLFNPQSGTTLTTPNIATIIISGKEISPAASFNIDEITVFENQPAASVSIKRQNRTDTDLQVSYSLVSDTAIAGEDIENISGTVTWAANETDSMMISLPLIDDEINEGDEQLKLVLSADSPDQLGVPSEVLIRIRDDESNQAPTITLTSTMQVNVRQSVQLRATSADAENDELSIEWNQTAGSDVVLNNADTLTPNFTAPAATGTLTFEITVSDPLGATANATVTITVISPPPPTLPTSSSSGGSFAWLLVLIGIMICHRRIPIFAQYK